MKFGIRTSIALGMGRCLESKSALGTFSASLPWPSRLPFPLITVLGDLHLQPEGCRTIKGVCSVPVSGRFLRPAWLASSCFWVHFLPLPPTQKELVDMGQECVVNILRQGPLWGPEPPVKALRAALLAAAPNNFLAV